jgi:hypothetical protein
MVTVPEAFVRNLAALECAGQLDVGHRVRAFASEARNMVMNQISRLLRYRTIHNRANKPDPWRWCARVAPGHGDPYN